MKHLRALRVVLASLFFIGITLLLLDFTGTLGHYLGWMAKVQFFPAVLALNVGIIAGVLIFTMLFGRIYCSVVCPLGVMQDGCSHAGKWIWKNRYRYVKERRWLRWGMIVLVVALLFLGLNAVAMFIAPYGAYGRIAQNLFQPVYLFFNNILAGWAEKQDSYAFHHVDIWIRSTMVFIVAAVTFVVVTVLSLRWGRAWCNNVCPVGTLLGVVSRRSVLHPVIDAEKCVKCRQCETNCKGQCIDIENLSIDNSRCVVCMDCLDVCKTGAMTFGRGTRKTRPRPNEPVDEGKRKFLAATAMVAGAAALRAQEKNLDGAMAFIENKKIPTRRIPLKPAGSFSLKHFSDHCTACQLCVAECPNGVLRPSKSLKTLMQPEMSFERGYCRPECTQCSEVCPTGAIKRVTPVEKSAIHIGIAVYVPQNCVVSTDGVSCGHCASHCPTGAIVLVPKSPDVAASLRIPSVNETACIGCGACENLCPARPYSAIYVEGRETHIEG